MQNFIVLFTLLTFSSFVVLAGLQEVINVAKYIADIHQELPNSCVLFIKSEDEVQSEKMFHFFPLNECCDFKNCVVILSQQNCKTSWKCIFGNNRKWIICGDINSLNFKGVFQLC